MKTTFNSFLTRMRRKTGINNLEKREKIVLVVGGVFIFCFLLFQVVIGPYFEAKGKLEKSLQRKKNEAIEIVLLQQDYQELKARQGGIAKRLQKRNPQFSLFSFLEKQATDVKVKQQVTYMKPSTTDLEDGFRESTVEMKIEEVTLNQLVDFLLKIESVENVVVVRRIAIQKSNKTSGLLDIVISIITFEKSA